jgi:hypothetical protein
MSSRAFKTGATFDARFKDSRYLAWGALLLSYVPKFQQWEFEGVGAGFTSLFRWGCLAAGGALLAYGLLNLYLWLRLESIGPQWGYADDGSGPWRMSSRLRDGSIVLNPEPQHTRVTADYSHRLVWQREWPLYQAGTAGAIVAMLVVFAYSSAWGWVVALCALGPLAAQTANLAIYVIAFQKGAQYITGARVLEPVIARADSASVDEQMAHGAARVATETEVASAAQGTTRRSSVHTQKF